jgi:hypothetical protein
VRGYGVFSLRLRHICRNITVQKIRVDTSAGQDRCEWMMRRGRVSPACCDSNGLEIDASREPKASLIIKTTDGGGCVWEMNSETWRDRSVASATHLDMASLLLPKHYAQINRQPDQDSKGLVTRRLLDASNPSVDSRLLCTTYQAHLIMPTCE